VLGSFPSKPSTKRMKALFQFGYKINLSNLLFASAAAAGLARLFLNYRLSLATRACAERQRRCPLEPLLGRSIVPTLLKQSFKHIRIAIVYSPTITRVAWASVIARVTRISNIPGIANMLINNHVLM